MHSRSFIGLLLFVASVFLAAATVEARAFPKSPRSQIRSLGNFTPPKRAERMTNAKRFAAGLPPLPPTRRTKRTALMPRASPGVPGFQIVNENNQVVYNDPTTVYSKTGTGRDEGILYDGSGSTALYYAGVSQTSDPPNLSPGSTDYVTIETVQPGTIDPTAADPVPYGGVVYEAVVWVYDSGTGEVTFNWNNANGGGLVTPPIFWSATAGVAFASFNPVILAQVYPDITKASFGYFPV
ncbi:hypothetical protein FRB99_006729 [Tulasnella sp. 403]|nr:hypothetical protein FRB99_006729 [Tulasnella sp. 403]